VLREQLHIMRERRLEETLEGQAKHRPLSRQTKAREPNEASETNEESDSDGKGLRLPNAIRASVDITREAIERLKIGRVCKTSKAMGALGTPEGLEPRVPPRHEDYSRRDASKAVPYRTAKRKLKIAMAEYYRGLELLKAYSLLNRTAFRKITKKYDKTVQSTAGKEYVKVHANNAHFVQSDTVDNLLQTVEDLYARYFERGNRKVAVSKLRQKIAKEGAFYGPTLRTGLLLGISIVFGIQGVVHAVQRLETRARWPEEKTETSYLLQIYAGYFMMWAQVILFCIDAATFALYRVNYQFIFEFDTRHMLNWKQLWELPALFGLLLGLCVWVNFSSWSPPSMFIYWPVVLIGVSLILFFAPPGTFYWRSRKWFLESNGRLLLAGLFPVEFRDFFLGDVGECHRSFVEVY
jgi:xenotropic and polytropic retrovirus receptor 1